MKQQPFASRVAKFQCLRRNSTIPINGLFIEIGDNGTCIQSGIPNLNGTHDVEQVKAIFMQQFPAPQPFRCLREQRLDINPGLLLNSHMQLWILPVSQCTTAVVLHMCSRSAVVRPLCTQTDKNPNLRPYRDKLGAGSTYWTRLPLQLCLSWLMAEV